MTTEETRKELFAVADNWYNRLNKLKDKYGEPATGISNPKAAKLIYELIARVLYITSKANQLNMPTPNFPEGGLPLTKSTTPL